MLHRGLAVAAGVVVVASAAASTVVMRVNGVGVTDYALGRTRRALATMQPGQTADEQLLMRQAVDQVIGHVLLAEAAREAGVTVDGAEVQRRVAAVRSRYKSAEEFTQALAAGGTSEAEMTGYEEENLLIQRYTESVLAVRAEVTKEEAAGYYREHPAEFDHPEQVKVRMILASVPADAAADVDAQAKARIAQVSRRLAGGEDFAKVASELSDDPTRSRGGEVGWVRRGQLLPELDEAVFKLEAGGVTTAIKTKYGYHVMGAIARRPAGRASFEEVETTLTGMLKSMKVRDLLGREVAARRAKATIETLDPAIRAALKP